MAIIACPECAKEISDSAVTCPHCGHPLKTSSSGIKKHKKAILKVGLALAALLVIAFISTTQLNKYEQLALENSKTLKSMLKTPSSFTLFDEILVQPDSDEPDTIYMYISYGGTNGYGAMVQSLAIFENSQYLGDYGDKESDFYSQKEYDRFLLASLPYALAKVNGRGFQDFIHVDSQKIMKHLS